MAAAFGMYLIGDSIWLAYDAALHISPFPSPADVAYLGFYPLLLAALLAFPVAQRSRREQAMLMFDFSAAFVAAVLGVWFLVIGPVGDLVVSFGLLAILARGIGETPTRAVVCLVVGVICFLTADLAFGYLSLHQAYRAGDWPDSHQRQLGPLRR